MLQEGSELFVSCLLNRAACYLKMERYGNQPTPNPYTPFPTGAAGAAFVSS